MRKIGILSPVAGAAIAALVVWAFATGAVATPVTGNNAPVTKMTFKLRPHTVVEGSAVTGSVLVQTRSANKWVGLPGASLSLQVDGVEVSTLTTDASGLAAISYTGVAGDHVMKVVFAGDALHKRAQRAQGFQVVGATPSPSPSPSASPSP